MLTTEELLRDRFRVVADYFYSPYKVGDIITVQYPDRSVHLTTTRHRDEFGEMVNTAHYHHPNDLKNFPHLFQPLPWWSDREPEQVEGLYIKCRDGRIGQIKKHVASDNGVASLAFFKFDADDQVGHYYYNMHPEIATLADYEAYNQQKEGMNG
jgi:hypothetical protein